MRELLSESVARYREILSLTEELRTMELDKPEEVLDFHARLVRLQKEAEAVDRRIEESLAASEPTFTLYPLLRERLELMAEIVGRNALLSPRIEAMMASALAELNEIRTGMTAIAGYRPAAGEKGKRLLDAF